MNDYAIQASSQTTVTGPAGWPRAIETRLVSHLAIIMRSQDTCLTSNSGDGLGRGRHGDRLSSPRRCSSEVTDEWRGRLVGS